MDVSDRTASAEAAVARLLTESSGFELSQLDRQASFLELGFDSLFLVQFSQRIKSQLKVKLSFRQLIEEIPNIESLIDYVARRLPETAVAAAPTPPAAEAVATSNESQAVAPTPTAAASEQPGAQESCTPASAPSGSTCSDVPQAAAPSPAQPTQLLAPLPMSILQLPFTADAAPADKAGLAQIIAQQNQLMSLQLQLLSGARGSVPPQPPVAEADPQVAAQAPAITTENPSVTTAPQRSTETAAAAEQPKAVASGKKSYERFGPYKPVRHAADGGLTDHQQKSLDAFVARFTKRTAKSRQHAQQHRPHFADPRGVAGYRRIWKSLVYQIAVEKSKGCRLWDIDGNEYIDIAMGFGLNLFGQSPEFINDAIARQLEQGVQVGPQSPLAGEVAQLLCDFSRKERVTFCNTGSEAVMAAMRLARTVTGKSKVVFFNKDYHGNFDQVLIRSSVIGHQRRAQPAAPGVPQFFADHALVLDYGTEEALQTIVEQADEIAAVLVEPVQSADLFTQPKEFLHEVRRITKERQIAMIMDEVISGFRVAQGGAQEWFDVWADMATYGKILGGGLPIGALAGSAQYMDALDGGGQWKYEDDSDPEADMTFFAGTFVRHPLAMAAAHQVLMKVKESGPELQQQLTAKATHLADSLNDFFDKEVYPFRIARFASQFRFMFPPTVEYADLLYYHLLDRGIFSRGWGDNCFLSTAHTDEDVARIIDAVKDSCEEIRAGGFLPKPDAATESASEAVALPSDPAGEPETPAPAAAAQAGLAAPARLSTVEEIRDEGDLPPLFCMPAADGLAIVFHELADRLENNQPVYGLNSPGAYGEPVPDTIEEMATRFIEDMREVQPHGPYFLIGYCSGGSIAFEAAQQLVAAGETIGFLCGIETYDWSTNPEQTFLVKTYHQIQRLEFHLRNFLILDWKNKGAFLRSKLKRAKNRIRVWRGILTALFKPKKPKSLTSRSEIDWNQIWHEHNAQADRYVPKILSGKLLLIRPRKDFHAYAGKEDLRATEGVRIVRLPAFPAGLMSAPFVDQVAELVQEGVQQGLQQCAGDAADVAYRPNLRLDKENEALSLSTL